MSAISSGIGAGATATPTSSLPNRFSEMSSEDFIRVLFTELQNQDPLQPHDSSKMLEQLSSLRNIESQLALQNQMEDLVTQNQVAIAGGLIGKFVEGKDADLNPTSGLVQSVRVAGEDVFLELDNGKTMKMDDVISITDRGAATGA